MISPFLQRKWALAYYRFDTTKDGVVRVDDFQRLGEQVAQNLGFAAGSDSYATVVRGYHQGWDAIFKLMDQDADNAVTLAEYLAANEYFTAQPNARELGQAGTLPLVAALDADRDGLVTLQEYTAFLQAFGVAADQARTAFQQLDRDGNGTLAPDEIAASWADYYISDDPATPGNWFYGGV
jgi:Ca2+-binding EF-hand superfamily protein